jgi:hypothetical protein
MTNAQQFDPAKILYFDFATDSESGEIAAYSFAEAVQMLREMLTDDMIDDGARGWVEDCQTGNTLHIGPDGDWQAGQA